MPPVKVLSPERVRAPDPDIARTVAPPSFAERVAVVAVSEVTLEAVSTPVVPVIEPLLSVTAPRVSEKPARAKVPPLTVIALELPSWSEAPKASVPPVTEVIPL